MRVSVEKGHPRQAAALCRWAEVRRWPGHASPGSGIRARALSCRKGIKSGELGVAGAGQGVRDWGFPGAHLQPLAPGGGSCTGGANGATVASQGLADSDAESAHLSSLLLQEKRTCRAHPASSRRSNVSYKPGPQESFLYLGWVQAPWAGGPLIHSGGRVFTTVWDWRAGATLCPRS